MDLRSRGRVEEVTLPILRSTFDTEYASWPVKAPAGVDITGDVSSIGFSQGRWDEPAVWHPAALVVDSVRYGDSAPRIRILLGPANGGIVLAKGTWFAFGKISDDPEEPAKFLDTVTIR